MIRRSLIAAVAAVTALSACGGGGSTTVSSVPNAPLAPQIATAQLKLLVPAKSSQARAKYVSPSTQSVGVVVDSGSPSFTNVSASSPGCSGGTAPYNCTITVSATTGVHTVAFTTYDQPNGGGHQLSTNSTSVTFTAGQTPSIPLVLNGIPSSVAVLPATQYFASNPAGGFYTLEGNTETVSVVTLDADNNIIVGAGAPTIAVTAAPSTSVVIAQPNPALQPNTFTINDGAFETSTLAFVATPPGGGRSVTLSGPLTGTTYVSTFSGSQHAPFVQHAAFSDGSAGIAEYSYPQNIAMVNGTLYLADRNNCRIRSIVGSGANAGTASTLAGAACYGSSPASTATPPPALPFYHPSGVAFDTKDGNLYVTDFGRCQIDQVSLTGTVTPIAGTNGTCAELNNATGTSAEFYYPATLAYDSGSDALYVGDVLGCSVRKIVASAPFAVSTAAVAPFCAPRRSLSTTYGRSGLGFYSNAPAGPPPPNNFIQPGGIASDGQGDLYLTDQAECTLLKVATATGVTTQIAGGGTGCGNSETDGSGTQASFLSPAGIAYANGTLYVADTGAGTIRAVTVSNGSVITIAGSALCCGYIRYVAGRTAKGARRGPAIASTPPPVGAYLDGWGATAGFAAPTGIVYDAPNNRLLVTDTNNNVVRQILL